MGKQVEIKVRGVGQAFGCVAEVFRGQRKLYETRVYPHGQRGNAYQGALAECEARGWSVRDADA